MSKIDSSTFDKLLEDNNPFDGGQSHFNLADVTFISASGMVQLTAACHALSGMGAKPIVQVVDDSVRGYMSRSGFFSALDGIAVVDPPIAPGQVGDDYRWGRNPFLIEVTRIDSGKSLPELLDRIIVVLRRKLRYRQRDAFDIAIAISELSQNTFDHNSNTCGFLAMQGYGSGTGRFLEFAVADFGNGLLNSLKRNHKYRALVTDIDAIHLAIKPGVSEHNDATRGTGLYHLVQMTAKHGGSLQIRSGSGKVRFRMDIDKEYGFDVPFMPGVQVSISLPTKRK